MTNYMIYKHRHHPTATNIKKQTHLFYFLLLSAKFQLNFISLYFVVYFVIQPRPTETK